MILKYNKSGSPLFNIGEGAEEGLDMDELEKIKKCFRDFIEGSLILHDINTVIELFADDIMGIGMGAQGVVRCKEDMRPILMNTRSDVEDTTTVQYSNTQIRYYGDDYANICSTITINTETRGKLQKSHIGQCASLRRIEGVWKINMVQATPLSVDIQEIDAYPLSFAEDEIERYRMQEQFSNIMQRNVIATYKIDFELGKYEEYISNKKYSPQVKQGDNYESEMIKAANDIPDEETRRQFIKIFSINSMIDSYHSGQTDITLDYESIQPDGQWLWLRSNMHLFTDIKSHLKGYLYLFDIDKQKKQELILTQQAELDLMTSVYNKETTRKKIELAINLYSMPRTCAFFMFDLDFFKQINDTYGHASGDEVIRQTADILKRVFHKEDIIGRLGGDEFCVFYTGKNHYEVLAKKAEQVCEAIRKIRPAKNSLPGTTVSIGIVRRIGNESFDELYQKADKALYVRKAKQGRDGYTIYDSILSD